MTDKVIQFVPFAIALIVIIIAFILAKSMYKIADVDKALIITGGKKPKIIISGGAFVVPVIRKADFFDLCMLTVRADRDEIMTKTAVPVIVDWTAQIRPDRSSTETLETAIISFKERGNDGIVNDVRLTLMGAVRDVVASMKPEEVLVDKEAFKSRIQESVDDELSNMGLELVSLNIQDITDPNGFFDNIAYLDEADKRREADVKKAETDRITRERRAEESLAAEKAEAEASKQAETARMDAEQTKSNKRRETDLIIAQNKVATDTAQADAEIAKQLQATIREREVEQQRGAVEITRQEQAQLAAEKRQQVKVTEAETEKAQQRIKAEAEATVAEIDADREIAVASRKADAMRQTANGDADVEKTKADARVAVAKKDAEALVAQAEAEAAKKRAEGTAEADVLRASQQAEADGKKAVGLAEAEAIKAKKLAEAEGEKALAEARAASGQVNFEIEKLRIQTEAQISIATTAAQIMANIGQNAEFVNIGGATPGANGGNAFFDTLMGVPGLMKALNAQSEALNGMPMQEQIADLSDAVLKGLQNLGTDAGEPVGTSSEIEVSADESLTD